jgi:Ala-tRNA(Pro) deacylase
MAILRKLQEFLEENRVSYEVKSHPEAFTAQEIAAAQHVPGRQMTKVVILKADGSFVMAALPAHHLVDFDKARASLGAKQVSLATEQEFASLFPECEPGAMPPFGNLFGLPVYVDQSLEDDEVIYFNAGNHRQTVKMRYQDFKALAQPKVVALSSGQKSRAA